MPTELAAVPNLDTVTGVAPSATANTYGSATSVWPHKDYRVFLHVFHVALTSGGTFGAETLTVRIRTMFADGTSNSVTKTFTATGGETALTNTELFTLHTDAKAIIEIRIDCQSTIGSSTATGGAKVGVLNATKRAWVS